MFGGGTADGDGTMKDKLGGKGAGLAEMSKAGVPVPPGFTIITSVCNYFFEKNEEILADVDAQIWESLDQLEVLAGKRLGDAEDPLLLSVRSGAKFSMPGMMNTILNLGLNDATVEGLVAKTGNPRFAYDCYRRFIQMFGEVALGIEMELFDHAFDERKHKIKAKLDTDLSADDPEGDYRRLQEDREEGDQARIPAGHARATPALAQRGVQFVVGAQGVVLPQDGKDQR
jgi:pyruvate,orthophosphate dikinase